MSWLYKYFRLVLGSTYPALQLHDATLKLSGTGATLTLASGATVNEFSTDGTLGGNSDTALPTEKAVKTYVDTVSTGIKWKAPVRVATTTNGTIGTAYANGQTVDGKTLATGDRILLKDQSDQTANGIYTVNATGAPTRATDSDTAGEILGCVVAVLEGTVNEDSAWCNTNSTAITIGSSNITFAIFGGMKAGNGITFTADVISIDTTITCDLTTSQAITNKSKVAITSQSAAYTDSALQVGKYGTAIADTILLDNILVSFVNSSGVNKTSADTSSMTLYVGNATTAAVTNNKMQCILSSMNIGHNMYDAYAVQGHMAVTGNCGTQNANAHVTGLSGKFSISTSKTLATGWATAILGIVDGAGAVTQMCHVVSAVCEAGVTACQSLFHAYTDSTVNAAIQCSGTVNMTHLFDFDAAAGCVGANDIHIDIAGSGGYIPYASSAAQFVTLTGAQALTNKTNLSITSTSASYDNSALNVGKYGTAIADTLTADNILVSFVNSSGVNKTGADTSSMTLYVGNATTGAVTNNKMQGVLSSMAIGHNVFDAYAGQFHTRITASMGTQNANAHLTGVSAKITFVGTPTVATGWVTAGLFIIEGTGTCSQMCHGVSIVEEAGSTGAQSMLHLNTDVGTTPYFSFAGADGSGNSIYTHTAAGTQLGTIKILVNGVDKWIPFMQAE